MFSPQYVNNVEEMITKINNNPGGTICNKMLQALAYTNYVGLISRSVKELQNGNLQWEKEGKNVKLRIGQTKTQYMIASREMGTCKYHSKTEKFI